MEVALFEIFLCKEMFNKIKSFLKKFLQCTYMHEMKLDICFFHAHNRKMIIEEIIHVTRIGLLFIDDLRLLLLIGSTKKLPKLILWQRNYSFLGTAYTAWTQKERARDSLCSVSFSFCGFWLLWWYLWMNKVHSGCKDKWPLSQIMGHRDRFYISRFLFLFLSKKVNENNQMKWMILYNCFH